MMADGKDVDVAVLEAIHMGNDVGKLLMNVHLTSMVFKQLWSAGYVRHWRDLGDLPDIPEEAWSTLKIDFPFEGHHQARRQSKSATSNSRLRGLAYSNLVLTPIIGLSTVSIASSSIVRARMIGTSVLLGNDKPEVIQEVEDVLFKFYYEMWENGTSVFSAILPMLDRLPWRKLLSISDNDPIRQWFQLALPDTEASSGVAKKHRNKRPKSVI
ncbi:hypothetical protein EST38_g6610 [Candolleomyces aberdarensis]|uniref:Uncharacterized protein n=1 Tax=Candolleomyces aberdarensis TaxID=2316362 RepID=A0A4Q2DJ83_9AGAR|nr:hypothetical protein EST38_g6610 [Candolleomyces aberdarensis]